MREIRRIATVAMAAGLSVLIGSSAATASPANKDKPNDAICDTHDVVVKGEEVPVMAEPKLETTQLFTAQDNEFFKCSALMIGGKHSACGDKDSQNWIIITDFKRFDVYIPSSCLTDVYF